MKKKPMQKKKKGVALEPLLPPLLIRPFTWERIVARFGDNNRHYWLYANQLDNRMCVTMVTSDSTCYHEVSL